MVKRKMKNEEFLCCPYCQKNLKLERNFLVCGSCGKKYKFKNGIFDFVNSKKLSGQELKQLDYFSKAENVTTADYYLEEWQKSFIRRFLENFPEVKGKVILDAGVGQGYMTIELAKMGAKVLACDLSFLALLRLQKVAKKIEVLENIVFIACSLEKLPVKSKIVNGIISNAVLEHIAEEEKAISELGRVAKKTAGLMITVPLKYRYNNPLFIPSLIWQDRMIGHLRRYDGNELTERFKKFGFSAKKTYYSGHFRKVVFTKIFSPLFGLDSLLPKFEAIDCRSEQQKYGASNICIYLERP